MLARSRKLYHLVGNDSEKLGLECGREPWAGRGGIGIASVRERKSERSLATESATQPVNRKFKPAQPPNHLDQMI